MTYFPPGSFPEATAERYSDELAELDELPLVAAVGETIRFLWLRTFHPPVVIRIIFPEDGPGRLPVVSRKLHSATERILTPTETAAARKALAFLALGEAPPGATGRDGSEWIFEYRSGPTYSAVSVWSPEDGAWHAAGLFLIGLSGLVLAPYEIY